MSIDDEILRKADSLASELSNGLVTLERSPDDEAVAGLLRAAHTLKGNCAMAGIDGAATLTHAVEDFLAAVRTGDVVPSETLVDGALNAVDDIEAILNAVGGGTTPAVDPDAAAASLRDLIQEQGETDIETASADTDTTRMPDIDLEVPEPDPNLSAEEALERASAFDDLDRLMSNMGDNEAFAGLEGVGTFDAIDGEKKSSSPPDGEPSSQPNKQDPKLSAVKTPAPDASEDSSMEGGNADAAGDDTDETNNLFKFVKIETIEETDGKGTNDSADTNDHVIDFSNETADTPSARDEGQPDEDILDAIENIDLDQTESPVVTNDVEFERETGTKAFAERFGELFDVESDDEDTIRSVGTIEESKLNADRFRQETSVDVDPTGTSIQSINVDVGTADDLLNLVKELSMNRLSFEKALGDGVIEEAKDALNVLHSIEAGFHRSVMELRLMPLSSTVDTLPRVVRDIARDQAKRISFDVEGEDVKLDRSVVERIGEPLVHLVRNAADHGIELPEKREIAGKSAEGRIELRAERVRNGAVIEVEDDGRGIDPDAVLMKGVEEGVVTRSEAETMDDEDAYDLLFQHGLTTCEEITKVSGRGVGMNIVARVCSELDGSVEVESELGGGTIIRLQLPVTVAMAQMLFVEASGERYAIPMSDIEYIGNAPQENEIDDVEFVPAPAADLDVATDDENNQYRLVRLHEMFDIPTSSTDEGVVIWLRPEIGRVAIHCDNVIESREVVVKPYGPPLDHVPGISGATIGESGDVINIIDVTTIA
jgi:two-component system chemotaxis sensor kinase CheA